MGKPQADAEVAEYEVSPSLLIHLLANEEISKLEQMLDKPLVLRIRALELHSAVFLALLASPGLQ